MVEQSYLETNKTNLERDVGREEHEQDLVMHINLLQVNNQ